VPFRPHRLTKANENVWFSYKQCPTTNILFVVGADGCFKDVTCGCEGCKYCSLQLAYSVAMHDGTIFDLCGAYNRIPEGYFVLGDAAFRNRSKVCVCVVCDALLLSRMAAVSSGQ